MKKETKKYDVIVVGGGASGMMAAGRAATRGKRVLLLEKNAKLGRKLAITGGGRCNILNAEEDKHVLLSRYGKAEQFLRSPFSRFGMEETYNFFESRDLPLKVEANKRAFPASEKAEDVVALLREYVQSGEVDIRTGSPVKGVVVSGNRIEGVLVGNMEYAAESFIFATGGLSHPETGSTGDGFAWLSQIGHTVEKPTPTIVPLKIKESWVKRLAGATMDGVKIAFFESGNRKKTITGKVLFTHFGISGPTILNAAGMVADLLQAGPVTLRIDTAPGLDLGPLDKKLTALFDENKNKLLKNVFKQIAPTGTSDVLLSLLPDIDAEKKVHSVTKAERRALAELLKNIPLTVEGLMGFDRAVVADGGLVLTEIDTKTMRSNRFENLYVIGDLLHISRPSGGFSLQLCWTSGFIAGESV